jgi:CBS domain-containing protein
MKVSEVMTTEVESVQLNSTVEEVASIMKVENIGSLPVVDEDDDLVGIITDRDIVVRCVAEGKNPADTNVEEILSHELETIEPDVDIEEAAQLMADRQIRRLPVCEDGELVGMISIGDLAVKTPRIEASAQALREISKGVKGDGVAGPRMNASPHEGGSRAPRAAVAGFSDDEDLNLEFSDEKDLAASDMHERHANRHHQPRWAKGPASAKKKLHPISESGSQQDLGSLGEKKQGQGMTKQAGRRGNQTQQSSRIDPRRRAG